MQLSFMQKNRGLALAMLPSNAFSHTSNTTKYERLTCLHSTSKKVEMQRSSPIDFFRSVAMLFGGCPLTPIKIKYGQVKALPMQTKV
ncbi:hypothetical protein ABH968_001177 [Lysinibacillus sp. RC79]